MTAARRLGSLLGCAACGLYHAVFRETREEPLIPPRHILCKAREEALERALPSLVADFSSPSLLQDRVAVHSQDVVDAADSQTFQWENKFRLGS